MMKSKKIVLGPERKAVTFRMNATLADQVTTLAKDLGLSTCQVYEGIAAAFAKGTAFITSQKDQKNRKTTMLQVPWICFTMNVQVVREVLKARRYYKEYTSEKQANPYLNFDVGSCGETVSELIADY